MLYSTEDGRFVDAAINMVAAVSGSNNEPTRLAELKIEKLDGSTRIYNGEFVFRPAAIKSVSAGDSVRLWVEARDNKQPAPNLTRSTDLTVKIVAPPDQ